jgi:hypothetical protein
MGAENFLPPLLHHSTTPLFTASGCTGVGRSSFAHFAIRHLSPGSFKYCGYNLRAHSGQTL